MYNKLYEQKKKLDSGFLLQVETTIINKHLEFLRSGAGVNYC